MQTLAVWTHDDLHKALGETYVIPRSTLAGRLQFDSRCVQSGDIFIALKGPNKDGHDFISDVLQQGAGLVIVSENWYHQQTSPPIECLPVKDTFATYETLANYARRNFSGTVIAVTGTYGKTTTKEMLRRACQSHGPTYAVERSYNNVWGVISSLGHLPQQNQFGIFELGMNHRGEILPLTKRVRPHVALITNIGDMHIGNLGSRLTIAEEKSDIFFGLEGPAIAILNRDCPLFEMLKAAALEKGAQKILSFGQHQDSDIHLVKTDVQDGKRQACLRIDGHPYTMTLTLIGEHILHNALGVLAVLWACGGDIPCTIKALETFLPVEGRGEKIDIPWRNGPITVFDETYNAGPASMLWAIKTLAQVPLKGSGRRAVVLGDMLELGAMDIHAHQDLSKVLLENGISLVFTYGPLMKHLYDALPNTVEKYHMESLDHLCEQVPLHLLSHDVVLVKGSKGQRDYQGKMYKVIEALKHYQPQKRAG